MTSAERIICCIVLIAGGIYNLVCALSNRESFFRARSIKALDKFAGRRATRILCAVQGIVIAFIGVMVLIFPD